MPSSESAAQCCDKVYFCPASGDTECPVHGGFDVCCDRPDLHRPVASAASTEAIWTMTDSEFRDELFKAFVEGFAYSHEGFNGEYPKVHQDRAMLKSRLRGRFDAWWHRG